MKKNIGRIFNNRIVAGDKNIISKGEGFVSKESAVFIRTDNGFEGENPEPPVPPVPPEPTNRIIYTATTKPTSTWITNNCLENNFNAETGEGYLVLKEGVDTVEGEDRRPAKNIFNDGGSDSNVESVILPSQITSIGECAFISCIGLTSVIIPNSVTSLGYCSFYNCTSLASVTCEATTPPTWGYASFENIATTTCSVPAGSVSAYEASDWANYFTTFTEIQ